LAPIVLWVALLPRTARLPHFELRAPVQRPEQMTLLSGAVLRLDHGMAQVDQTDPNRTRVRLLEGRLLSSVPHVNSGGAFLVATADCEVIVHGTRFEVEKHGDETRVHVEEGRVEVRPSGARALPSFVDAGRDMVVPSREKYLANLAARVRTYVATGNCDAPQAELEEFAAGGNPESEVSGVEYLLALCAAQRGESARAIALFERAADHANDSVRADNALARAAQLSSSVSAGEGITAWKRYLSKFPGGLHRELAEQELRRLDGAQR
jgi:hypothetical protein